MSLLKLENLSKSFERPAVENVNLSLGGGRILCLLGPSGCGKTTLLRLIAGLTRPDSGRVVFNGADLTDVAPHKREFGLMFQEFALFPHKNVFDNVAFGPRMQNMAPAAVRRLADNMLALVGMADFGEKNVEELSGGERQRVALARSLATRPRLLMLDEPLGALDRNLRERLLPEIRSILKKLEMPAIFVTHDQSEAFAVADKIAVMHQGRIEQVDSPEMLYLHPRSEFTARFLGFQNLIEAETTGEGSVKTILGVFYPPGSCKKSGVKAILAIRPEGAAMAGPDGSSGDFPRIRGVVKSRVFTGQTYKIKMVEPEGTTLLFDLPNAAPPPPPGKQIDLAINPSSMVVIFPPEVDSK